MDTAVSVELFVEILNRYVYYFDQQNEAVGYYPLLRKSTLYALILVMQVTTKYLNGLIELIHSNLQTGQEPNTASLESPKKHFHRTLEYIKSREYEGVVTEP